MKLSLLFASTALATACACAPQHAASPPPSAPVVQAAAAQAAIPEQAPPEPQGETVTLFVADDVCGALEPRDVPLSDASPVEAVRAVLRTRSLAHLPLAAPEVHVEHASARVDLTMLAGSKRHSLSSLSDCETHALLDAISMTLRANPRWGIHHVLFTERGNLFAI